jgi:CBS domain-containing protein
MTRQPLVASPDEPLESAIERMTVADVGRLPVVRDGELLGIVTRSDLLRNLYAGRKGSMR